MSHSVATLCLQNMKVKRLDLCWSEFENLKLILLQSQLQSRVGIPTTPNSVTTPSRRDSYSPPVPDTPSREVILEPEPRGAEFEVWCCLLPASLLLFDFLSPLPLSHFFSFQYFKNVLFEYMMGRQTRVSHAIIIFNIFLTPSPPFISLSLSATSEANHGSGKIL